MAYSQDELLFGLNELTGIGWATIKKITLTIADYSMIFHLTMAELMHVTGMDTQKAEIIKRQFTPQWIDKRLQLLKQFNVSYITHKDSIYPSSFKGTKEEPFVLYYKGDINLLCLPAISIVGTRNPTGYGMKCATILSRSIAAHGVTVVSGLAKGIDAYVHKAALSQPGKTIAVMATGFDRIYPSENLRLSREIEEHGLILTEMPLSQTTNAGSFPKRNRIIAALGMATVVVEAAHHSGSLITSNFAADFGRPVCVVPGNIFSAESEGTLRLLFDGAHPVGTAEHVFKACGLEMKRITQIESIEEHAEWNENEKFVLALLRTEPMSIDEIYQHCKFSLGHLHLVLLSLQMRKAVEALPGSYFISLK
jgi:DNA processing protein